MVCTQLGSLCWFTGLNRSVLDNTSLILLHPAPAIAKSKIISSIFILKGRDQFNQNFGPKLNGSVRSNRKSFEKTGLPSTSSPGLFPKKVLDTWLVHLLRWTTFSGRTGWNFGRMPLGFQVTSKNLISKSQGLLRFYLHLAKDLLQINFWASFQRDSVFRFYNIALSYFPSLLRVTLIGTLPSDKGKVHENVAENRLRIL